MTIDYGKLVEKPIDERDTFVGDEWLCFNDGWGMYKNPFEGVNGNDDPSIWVGDIVKVDSVVNDRVTMRNNNSIVNLDELPFSSLNKTFSVHHASYVPLKYLDPEDVFACRLADDWGIIIDKLYEAKANSD